MLRYTTGSAAPARVSIAGRSREVRTRQSRREAGFVVEDAEVRGQYRGAYCWHQGLGHGVIVLLPMLVTVRLGTQASSSATSHVDSAGFSRMSTNE